MTTSKKIALAFLAISVGMTAISAYEMRKAEKAMWDKREHDLAVRAMESIVERAPEPLKAAVMLLLEHDKEAMIQIFVELRRDIKSMKPGDVVAAEIEAYQKLLALAEQVNE